MVSVLLPMAEPRSAQDEDFLINTLCQSPEYSFRGRLFGCQLGTHQVEAQVASSSSSDNVIKTRVHSSKSNQYTPGYPEKGQVASLAGGAILFTVAKPRSTDGAACLLAEKCADRERPQCVKLDRGVGLLLLGKSRFTATEAVSEFFTSRHEDTTALRRVYGHAERYASMKHLVNEVLQDQCRCWSRLCALRRIIPLDHLCKPMVDEFRSLSERVLSPQFTTDTTWYLDCRVYGVAELSKASVKEIIGHIMSQHGQRQKCHKINPAVCIIVRVTGVACGISVVRDWTARKQYNFHKYLQTAVACEREVARIDNTATPTSLTLQIIGCGGEQKALSGVSSADEMRDLRCKLKSLYKLPSSDVEITLFKGCREIKGHDLTLHELGIADEDHLSMVVSKGTLPEYFDVDNYDEMVFLRPDGETEPVSLRDLRAWDLDDKLCDGVYGCRRVWNEMLLQQRAKVEHEGFNRLERYRKQAEQAGA